MLEHLSLYSRLHPCIIFILSLVIIFHEFKYQINLNDIHFYLYSMPLPCVWNPYFSYLFVRQQNWYVWKWIFQFQYISLLGISISSVVLPTTSLLKRKIQYIVPPHLVNLKYHQVLLLSYQIINCACSHLFPKLLKKASSYNPTPTLLHICPFLMQFPTWYSIYIVYKFNCLLNLLMISCCTRVSEVKWMKVTQLCLTLCYPMGSMEFSRPEYWSG